LGENLYQPLSFGRLLDRSFRVYRSHWVKLMLVTLLMFGPFYLMYGWIFSDTIGTAFSFDFNAYFGDETISTRFGEQPETEFNGGTGALLFFFLFVGPVFTFVLIPMAFSVVTIMVKSVYDREEPMIGAAIKRTLKRFWPLFGNSLLFGLIMFGMYVVLIIVIVIVVMIIAVIAGLGAGLNLLSGVEPGPGLIVAFILIYIAIVFLIYALLSFFIIRWGYYVPAVVLDEAGVGLGRSWSLTRGSFWRMFFVFLVLTLIMTAFYTVYGFLVQAFVPVLFLKILLPALIYILLFPLYLVTYGVGYWDMKIRTEGVDLERMLQNVQPTQSEEETEPKDE
jgi:hypothetical protein